MPIFDATSVSPAVSREKERKTKVVQRDGCGSGKLAAVTTGVRVLFSRARLGRDEASYRRERCARRFRRSPPRLIANDTVDSNILLGLISAHSGFSSWAKVSIDWPRIGCAIGTSECQQPFLQRKYRAPVSVFADPLEAPSRSSVQRPRPP